jgi:hypothetical protein
MPGAASKRLLDPDGARRRVRADACRPSRPARSRSRRRRGAARLLRADLHLPIQHVEEMLQPVLARLPWCRHPAPSPAAPGRSARPSAGWCGSAPWSSEAGQAAFEDALRRHHRVMRRHHGAVVPKMPGGRVPGVMVGPVFRRMTVARSRSSVGQGIEPLLARPEAGGASVDDLAVQQHHAFLARIRVEGCAPRLSVAPRSERC